MGAGAAAAAKGEFWVALWPGPLSAGTGLRSACLLGVPAITGQSPCEQPEPEYRILWGQKVFMQP